MPFADVREYCKLNNIPLSAVKCTPHYDEKKGRVSKGNAICHKGWKDKGRFENNKTTTSIDGSPSAIWMMSLKKAGMFVIDIDVKGDKKAKDILNEDHYNAFYNTSNYIIETGSGGLHFYFKIPNDFKGKVQNFTNIDTDFFKEGEEGSVDIIMDAIITEGSSYVFEDKIYKYTSIKNGINSTSVWDKFTNFYTQFLEKDNNVDKKGNNLYSEIAYDEVVEHLDNIPNSSLNWEEWYEMAQTIFNIGGDYELFQSWSLKNPNHNESETFKLWKGLSVRNNDDKKRGIGSLLYLSKRSNETQFLAIRKKYAPLNEIIDDEYASRQFVKIMGENIIKSDGIIYIYNENEGMWENGDDAFRNAVARNRSKLIFTIKTDSGEKVYNYGGSEKNVMAMRKWLATSIAKNTVIDISKSKGCLLFNDGWYDMGKEIFNEGFELCRDKFFTRRIDRKFNPIRNNELENQIRKILFVNPLNNPKIGDLYANLIALAISGSAMKVWPMIVGNPNCGKTLITLCLKYTFGGYVGEFNLNNLKFNPRDGSDEAKKLAWLNDLIYCRICLSNEARMDGKALDGNMIKALSSGGDSITLRTNFKDPITVYLMSMYFSFMNDMPPINPCDQALKNRLVFLPFTKSFVDKPQAECNEYEMESDPLLKEKIKDKDWIDAFFWVIMSSYNKGVMIEKPAEVIAESDEMLVIEDVKIKSLLEEKYEFVPTSDTDNYVSARNIIQYLSENGVKMSDTKIGKELAKIGLRKADKKVDKKTIRVWYGLKE